MKISWRIIIHNHFFRIGKKDYEIEPKNNDQFGQHYRIDNSLIFSHLI